MKGSIAEPRGPRYAAAEGTELTPAPNNLDNILQLLPPSEQAIPPGKGDTPTGEALEAAYAQLDALQSNGPKYLVLLTDGLPEHCMLLDSGVYCGHDPALAVVQDAHQRGIVTFAVGIGLGATGVSAEDEAADYFLNSVAHAGQGLSVPPPPFQDQFLPCLNLESQAIRGVSPGADFWYEDGWRAYAAAEYGADGTGFTEQRYLIPTPEQFADELSQLVASTGSCQ